MAQFFDDLERNIVPRWRSFAAATIFGEVQPLTVHPADAFNERMLDDVLEDWRLQPGLSVACDVVSAAYSIGFPRSAEEAAKYVLSQDAAPPTAREIARQCLTGAEPAANPDFYKYY